METMETTLTAGAYLEGVAGAAAPPIAQEIFVPLSSVI